LVNFYEEFLDLAQYNGDLEIIDNGTSITLKIVTDEKDEDIQDLIGKRGSLISSLEDLGEIALKNHFEEPVKFHLDIANYRQNQINKLLELADLALKESIETNQEVAMKPTNSYNRLLVHNYISEKGGSTKSVGAEPDRYIVISGKPI